MPSFVKGVKRRIHHLKQIIHAGRHSPEPASDRCMSPVLKDAVSALPCSPVTMPASSRSTASTDTMSVPGGLMEGKEVEPEVSSGRPSEEYSTAETSAGDHGDGLGSAWPSSPSSSDSSSSATRPLSSTFDASSSAYNTAVESGDAHSPQVTKAPLESMSASSVSVDQLEPLAAQDVEPTQELSSSVPAEPTSDSHIEPSEPHEATVTPSETADLNAPGEEVVPEQPREEITFVSPPPPVLVEPPVPDPFLVDDSASSDGDSDNDALHAAVSDSQLSVQAAEEISLAASTTLSAPAPSSSSPLSTPSPNVNKSVPPTPAPISDDEEDEEETPEVYLPPLVHPTMFLPIPNTDPLTTLLAKYISDPSQRPARDLSGEWQGRDFHTLVMTNSWRALARMARDRIVATDPEDISLVLDLWYLRISSLARLRLTNQASAEMNNLFTVLYSLQPAFARDYLLDKLLPFELEVLHARGKYWTGDHMGYLDALWALVRKCRKKAKDVAKRKPRKAGADTSAEKDMWVERGSRVVLIIASQLIEMKDFSAAAKLLTPLVTSSSHPAPELQSAIARIYLQSGHLDIAARYFAEVESNPAASPVMKDMNAAMLATAKGDWSKAADILQRILVDEPDNFAAVNNLAVVLLSQGLIKEGIDVLEKALQSSPSTVVVAEPFLFNLSTLYELRSATAAQNKRRLLVEVAKWSGDGLKTACLKMPSN